VRASRLSEPATKPPPNAASTELQQRRAAPRRAEPSRAALRCAELRCAAPSRAALRCAAPSRAAPRRAALSRPAGRLRPSGATAPHYFLLYEPASQRASQVMRQPAHPPRGRQRQQSALPSDSASAERRARAAHHCPQCPALAAAAALDARRQHRAAARPQLKSSSRRGPHGAERRLAEARSACCLPADYRRHLEKKQHIGRMGAGQPCCPLAGTLARANTSLAMTSSPAPRARSISHTASTTPPARQGGSKTCLVSRSRRREDNTAGSTAAVYLALRRATARLRARGMEDPDDDVVEVVRSAQCALRAAPVK
jgi:hypothetical protein